MKSSFPFLAARPSCVLSSIFHFTGSCSFPLAKQSSPHPHVVVCVLFLPDKGEQTYKHGQQALEHYDKKNTVVKVERAAFPL